MLRWYCVLTRRRSEAQAFEHLQRQGFECLLPRVRQRVLRNGRRKTVLEALFPRYLFLRVDTETTSLASVRSTRGAVDVVRTAGQPAVVPDDLMSRLCADVDADSLVDLPEHRLHSGESVLITDGPLAGVQGLYAQAHGEHRALVLLDILGGRKSVSVSMRALSPVMAVHAV